MAKSLNTITVDGVTYDAQTYATQNKKSVVDMAKERNTLGKDAFLQLLVKQMEYQDPLDPQDNSQYLAQLAQFSALEQMTNVSSNLEKLSKIVNNIDTSVLVGQLSGMIGKEISWSTKENVRDKDGNAVVDDKGNPKTIVKDYKGVSTGVNIVDGVPKVSVEADGKKYLVEVASISSVRAHNS